ncbi:MAG: hypothetical protein QOE23_3567 [Pseudonocardiales bacterium]|jgi:hypothetical protein|nr:hypothetical protein [Pseudonocardiales bacterium]
MVTKFNGLPTHVLLVHVVVVMVPLAALLAVLSALWPKARLRLGLLTPLAALVAVAFVPVTTNAGEWLQEHVENTELVRRHVHMGDGLLVWAGLLFVLSAALWAIDVAAARHWSLPAAVVTRTTRVALSAVLCAVAVVAVVQVYRIGDSGARAAWDNRLSSVDSQGPD